MRNLATAAAAALVLLLAGCGTGAPGVVPTVTDPAPATTAPARTQTLEPETPPALAVGDVVPAADVETVREAAGHVYVTASGDGVVLAPGEPLPEPVLAEITQTSWGPSPAATFSQYGAELAAQTEVLLRLDDAQVPVILVQAAGIYQGQDLIGTTYGASIVGVPDARELNAALTNGTRAQVDADVASLLEQHPDAQVLDLTG
ncbi:hypothetical protein [Pseudactinotalea terrae]|uniref:hypothetical protein n=1 Tax=Pseudactinotalea terrae TaxID=1743262 RepID=UPI0012E22C63|nr:hypothetical protein [Pseudactinotalea terrae]